VRKYITAATGNLAINMVLTSFQCANTAIKTYAILQKIGLSTKQIQFGRIGILQYLLNYCKGIIENYTSYKSIDKLKKVVYYCIIELVEKDEIHSGDNVRARALLLTEHAQTFRGLGKFC
jgi:hypothetical protein